jgi:hypothetical protein
MCVWVPGLAGLRGTGLQSEYCALLCRLSGHGWQNRNRAGLGNAAQWDGAPARLCRPGVGEWTGRDRKCLWIPGLRAHPTEILWVWGVGVWVSTALVGQRSRAGGSEIPWCMEQRLCGPMGQGWSCSACYSFSIWCSGEASQELGVQSADLSALPWCFTSFKQVSSFLSKSLDHRGQKVCGCVPVTILDQRCSLHCLESLIECSNKVSISSILHGRQCIGISVRRFRI